MSSATSCTQARAGPAVETGARFVLEAAQTLRIGLVVGGDDLDGDFAVEGQVLCEEHRAHAALAEQPLHVVAALHRALQPRLQVFHLARCGGFGGAAGLVRPAGEAEAAAAGQRRVAAGALDRGRGYGALLSGPTLGRTRGSRTWRRGRLLTEAASDGGGAPARPPGGVQIVAVEALTTQTE